MSTVALNVLVLIDKVHHHKIVSALTEDSGRFWLLQNLVCTDCVDEFYNEYKRIKPNYVFVDESVIRPSSKVYKGKDLDIVKLVWSLSKLENKIGVKRNIIQFFPSDNGKRIEAQKQASGTPIYVLNHHLELNKLKPDLIINSLEKLNVGTNFSTSEDG